MLTVSGVKEIDYDSSVSEVSTLLDRLDKNEIGHLPWPSYPYKPSASFTIAYGSDCIFLKYFISEKQIRAVNDEPNSPVWQDTCVEFFVSFNDGKQYYNFEINCIGTILAAYGPDLEHRDFLPEKTIATIKTYANIDKSMDRSMDRSMDKSLDKSWGKSFDKSLDKPMEKSFEATGIRWNLIAVIPFTVFIHDNISSLSGTSARANFYKCGDMLKEPHYLAWNDIKAPKPDFHLPAFFGRLNF